MAEATEIIEYFKGLILAIEHLNTELLELPTKNYWIEGEWDSDIAKEKALHALSNFYADLETPQQTFFCPGLIAVNASHLSQAKKINEIKNNFKVLANQYLLQHKSQDTKLIRQLLSRAGFSSLKLKQIYRQIRWIDFHPRRVSFSKVKHNSHKIINKEEAINRLLKVGQGSHIQVQLNWLNRLTVTEKLIIHRDVKPICAVNIATYKDATGRSTHKRILTSIPLLYLHQSDLPFPETEFSQPYQHKNQHCRNDKQIEDFPFLPSISAYRYKR